IRGFHVTGVQTCALPISFGILAYEMITGRPPFTGRSPQALLAAQVTEIPLPIQNLRPSVPPMIGTLVMRCLEKHAADRPSVADRSEERRVGKERKDGGGR